VDLKTCADASRFARDVFRYGYHLQAGWYTTAAEANGLRASKPFGWIIVQTAEPVHAFFIPAGFDVIEHGQKESARIAAEYRECERAGKYPHAFDGVPEINLPMYLMQDQVEVECE